MYTYDRDKVRDALSKEIKRKVWNVASLLRLASVHKPNFYMFMRGESRMSDKAIFRLLNVFQLDEKKFRKKINPLAKYYKRGIVK